MISNNFISLGINEKVSNHLASIGFEKPTLIQEKTLPFILKNNDIIAKAHTGSGKTLSFSLGILNMLNPKKFEVQSIILTPTRELANQVALEIRKVMKYHHNIKVLTLCGGMPYKPQVHSLFHKAHIIVGTPGRVLKHLESENFNTHLINTLVLDEADRMLDMGFFDDVRKIITYFPTDRQTMLFSATYPNEIEALSNEFMKNPINLDITDEQEKPQIKEFFYTSNSKKEDVKKILDNNLPESVIIFCNTKIDCDELADYLESFEIYPLVLHSDLDQYERIETLTLFENKTYKILIATDVASRGIDIDDIEIVINYELPRDKELYTHRIGRGARNNKLSTSMSLINSYQAQFLNEYTDQDMEDLKTPSTKYCDKSKFDTIMIFGGKKQKLRRGDIVGSLINEYNLLFDDIGIISQKEKVCYVAINETKAKIFRNKDELKIKGKYYHCKFIS